MSKRELVFLGIWVASLIFIVLIGATAQQTLPRQEFLDSFFNRPLALILIWDAFGVIIGAIIYYLFKYIINEKEM